MGIRIINLLVIKGMSILKINHHAKSYTQYGYKHHGSIRILWAAKGGVSSCVRQGESTDLRWGEHGKV
jgi:hypothetical protein